ncbi:MAG: hypothetical protein V1739_07205 [Candidatus Omnitrophota bacterium]
MDRFIRSLWILLILAMVFIQDGYAFWGRKKTEEPTTKAQQKQGEKTEAVKEKAVEKEVKKEIKQEATQEEQKKSPAKEADGKKETSEDRQKKIEEDKMLRQEKRKQLDNTQWEIEIKAIEGKTKEQTDILVFEDNRFYSDRSSKEGFNATNYTISIKDEEIVIWETMQTAEEGKINFWRGEISDKMTSMRGITSKKLPDGTSVNYSFTSTSKKAIK